MKKQVSTFKIHAKALASIVTALQSYDITARVRRCGPRSLTLRVCSSRIDCVKEALTESGYGHVTFCS